MIGPSADQRTWIVAHRGASKDHRENTIAAVQAALDIGCDAIEFDVQQTADDQLLVYHDDHLPTLDCEPIRRLPAALVRAKLADHGVDVPLLSDVLDLLRGRCFADIEFKRRVDPVFATARIREQLPLDAFHIKSFVDDHLLAIRDLDPAVRTVLVVGRYRPSRPIRTRMSEVFPAKRIARCGANQVHANWRLLRLGFLERMQQANVPVWVWTVDDPAGLIQCFTHLRVAGVITNDPVRARAIRAECEARGEDSWPMTTTHAGDPAPDTSTTSTDEIPLGR